MWVLLLSEDAESDDEVEVHAARLDFRAGFAASPRQVLDRPRERDLDVPDGSSGGAGWRGADAAASARVPFLSFRCADRGGGKGRLARLRRIGVFMTSGGYARTRTHTLELLGLLGCVGAMSKVRLCERRSSHMFAGLRV